LVIGGGSIGERHVRCFQRTGRVDVALCEVNPQIRGMLAERYGLAKAYADFDQALVAAAPDLAVVCTPAHLHIPMARRLVEAGIPTLIEKPLSIGLEGVEQLRRLAEERCVLVAVAYVYRAHPVLAEMRRELQSGRFGRPVQLVAVFGQNFPFYRPAYREIYYRDRATGGGAIQDALTHVVNAGEWLVGLVTELTADAAHQVLEGVDVEDTVHLLARHVGWAVPTGNPDTDRAKMVGEAHPTVLACYSLNQHQAANEGTITVACERGTIRFEMHRQRWQWMASPEEGWHEQPAVTLERDELFLRQAAAFLDAVDGTAEPLCSLDEAVQTLRVNLAALATAESHAWHRL
jgi:predicted dehydrogenase